MNDKQDKMKKITGAVFGIGIPIGLLIGIWQAVTSGQWWQILLWIIIGWMAAGMVVGIVTALMTKHYFMIILPAIGILIGTWMTFRTTALFPESGIWAWIWVILGASVGLMVGWWIGHRKLINSQGA